MSTRNDRHLTMEGLRQRIDAGDVDTVVLAFTDMQGRLQGKRLHGRYFLDHVVGHGTEGCNYLLAVDVDMNTVAGYAIADSVSGNATAAIDGFAAGALLVMLIDEMIPTAVRKGGDVSGLVTVLSFALAAGLSGLS